MFLCRTTLRTLRRFKPSAAPSARLCSKASESLWKLGTDESLEHNYPTPWIGVVSEIMKTALIEQEDFADFYNCLADKPLSFEEINMGREIFSTGYLGPRYERKWLFSSLDACSALSHIAMGSSFLQYFLANKEFQTPANYMAALRFASTETAFIDTKRELIQKMKEDFDKDDKALCFKDLRLHLKSEGDWETLLDMGETFWTSKNEAVAFFESAFIICVETLNLRVAQEVVEKYRQNDICFSPHMLTHTLNVMNLIEETSSEKMQMYFKFMDLMLQKMNLGFGTYISYEDANLLADFFSKLSSPKCIAAKDCGTDEKGQCSNCGTLLKRFNPSSSDLKCMLEDFKDVTFMEARKLYASKETFERFEEFVDCNGPFDLVFDLLNFMGVYTRQSGRLFKVLVGLVKQYNAKRILFISKVSVQDKNGIIIRDFLKSVRPQLQVKIFNVPKLFKDDAFVLYAAIRNNAYFVSNDAYRDHMALLPNRSTPIWKQWVVSRQIVTTPYVVSHPVDSMPLLYGSVAQSHLHIPHFSEPSNKAQSSKHAFLCLKISKSAQK